MVMNQDYDLARPLQSALKAKAPFVGVPIPGHAPLIFQRDKLVRALKGVKPIHLYVEVYENGNRALIVDGVAGPRCHTHLKALSLQRNHLVHWGDPMKAAERWRRGWKQKPATTRDPLAKYRKELERLDKALAKLENRPEIFNPATATGPIYQPDSYERELWRDWRAQRKLRGQVGRLAFLCHRGDLDSRKLYAALREIVSGFDTFSDLTAYERRRKSIDSFHDYANPKTLWMRCKGLAKCSWHGRPWTGRDDSEADKWGAKRYAVVLEWIRERRELESRIAAVKAMMEDAAAKVRA